MIPDTFLYVKPTTLNELFAQMKEPGALPYAGGTDVMPYLREGKLSPRLLVDVKALKELHGIRRTSNGVFIGAAESLREVSGNSLMRPFTAICQGAGAVGCMEIRNRATIGGNICNGSPSADSVPGLLVYDAKASLLCTSGRRTMPLCDFLLAPGKVALGQGEILEGVLLPEPKTDSQSRYYRRTRVKGMDLSGISAAIYCEGLSDIRIAFGALYKTVARASSAETILNAEPFCRNTLDAAVAAILSEVSPRKSSLRASPEYKKAMVPVLIKRALEEMNGGVFA